MYQSFQCNHLSDAIDIASFKSSYSFNHTKSFRRLLSIISMLLLYALGALPVLTNAWAEEATIVISTDNAEEVYFNGALLGKSSDWKKASSYKVTLQPGKNVLAVKGMDTGGIAALIAEIRRDGNVIVSDSSWKVSTTEHTGWKNVGFNDSGWASATTQGRYGVSPWGKNVTAFPSNSAAQWIWSANRNADDTVYFRYTITSNTGPKAEEAAIAISTDNAEEVYFNGVLLGKSSDWKKASSYKVTLQPGKNVLAVKGMDHGGIAALLAEISRGGNIIVSDTSWKVSTTRHTGWEKVGFDDSSWASATAYGRYGVSPWGKNVTGFPSNSAAQWIWSANRNADDTVYFRYTLTSNSSGNDSIPDVITTDVDKPIKINILGTSRGTVAIIDAPTKGTASIQADNTILYTPKEGYVGQDTLTYKITGPDGSITIATLTVKVGCTQCSTDVELTLTWKPSAGDVLGYRVYYGPTSGTVTQQLSDLYIATGEVNARAPAVTYNATQHLGMRSGDSVCFRVKAYNAAGESGFSTTACTNI